MTYKKILLQSEIKNEVVKSVSDAIDNLEINIPDNTTQFNITSPISTEDYYKLVAFMDFSGKIVEINDQENSRLIAGAISDIVEENPLECFIGKMVYCYCNSELTEGVLIKTDDKIKHYAMPQKDDLYHSYTIGKVIGLHDQFLYFDCEGNRKSAGEYEISIAKKLQFDNKNLATLARRPSLHSVRSIGSVSSRDSKPSSRLSTSGKLTPSTPRGLISKYRLVTFI
jgi:hypothetical protein